MTVIDFTRHHKATVASELKAAARLLEMATRSSPEARNAIMAMVHKGLTNLLNGAPGKISITGVDEGVEIQVRKDEG